MVTRADMLEAVIEIIELRDEWLGSYPKEEATEIFTRGCLAIFRRIVEKENEPKQEEPLKLV